MSTTSEQLAALAKQSKKGGRKKGKKGRKIGRYNKHPSSVRYRSESRWVSNKILAVARHLRREKGGIDHQARADYQRLSGRPWLAAA